MEMQVPFDGLLATGNNGGKEALNDRVGRQGTEALSQLKSKVERLTERRPKDRESKEKNITYGGLFGRLSEKIRQAATLSIKRGVELRSIKRL